MFDIGWMELMLIGVVALIVVGPRDLPDMFRQLGRITAKLRMMGREFSRAMEQAARESGADDAMHELKTLSNPVSSGMKSLKSAADKFEKWDPVKNAGRAAKPPAPAAAAAAAPLAEAASAAPASAAPAPAAPAPAAAGPETAALREKVAAKAAAAGATVAEAAEPAKPRKPGRTRKSKAAEE